MNKKKIVYITAFNVFGNVSSGGNQCGKRNFEFLCSAFGIDNIYVCMVTNDVSHQQGDKVRSFPKIKGNFNALISAFKGCKNYYPKDEKAIIEFINDKHADLIFFDLSTFGRLLKYVDRTKAVVFFQNIEQLYAKNKMKHEGFWYWPSYRVSKYNETLSVQKAKGIICLNDRDNKLLMNLYGRKADLLLPITFRDSFDEKKVEELQHINARKELLFVGSLFPPNLDGIEWFIDNVMPLLPEYVLTIVGKDFEKKREYLQKKNVRVVGYVEDVSAFYYRYPAVIMPIRYGNGMKVKTAEAIMYGKTIFATDEALEGYSVEGIKGIYRCNTVNEFVKNIKKFFESDLIPQYQSEVRNLFLEKYENTNGFYKFKDCLEKIMAGDAL